jgi:hypothetical protein
MELLNNTEDSDSNEDLSRYFSDNNDDETIDNQASSSDYL